MTAPRNMRVAHARRGVALTAAVALLVASCGDAAHSLDTVPELRVVQEQIDSLVGTTDVSVHLQNDHVLTITVGDAPVIGKPEAESQELFRHIAAAAYLAFPSRSQVEAVVVARVSRQKRDGVITDRATESQRFRAIQLIEPSGLTEHWVKPRDTLHRLYFVGVGHVRPDLVPQLAVHFRQTLGISVDELPAVSFDRVTVDNDRSRVVAEELVAAIRRRYPAAARDADARIIGVTGDDMYLRAMAGSWAFGLSWRSDDEHMAVVSYARMDPPALGLSPDSDMLWSRVTKMVAKNIGVLYFGLPLSTNPRSALTATLAGPMNST